MNQIEQVLAYCDSIDAAIKKLVTEKDQKIKDLRIKNAVLESTVVCRDDQIKNLYQELEETKKDLDLLRQLRDADLGFCQ